MRWAEVPNRKISILPDSCTGKPSNIVRGQHAMHTTPSTCHVSPPFIPLSPPPPPHTHHPFSAFPLKTNPNEQQSQRPVPVRFCRRCRRSRPKPATQRCPLDVPRRRQPRPRSRSQLRQVWRRHHRLCRPRVPPINAPAHETAEWPIAGEEGSDRRAAAVGGCESSWAGWARTEGVGGSGNDLASSPAA